VNCGVIKAFFIGEIFMSNVNKYEKVKLKINFRFIEVLVNYDIKKRFY
jgi:hypothetical protein